MKPKDQETTKIEIGETGLPSLGGFDSEQTATRHTETIAVSAAGRAAPRPLLVVLTGIEAGRIIAIGQAELTIGRAAECVLALPDRGVSHRHARIVRAKPDRTTSGAADSPFMLEDLKSKNGTFVDGVALTAPRRLAVGESFQIGPDVIVRLAVMNDAEEKGARQLYTSSMHDGLTSAFNLRYVARRLKSELAYAARHKTELSVMVLNFDCFKILNDTHGHATGDAVLKRLTKLVQAHLRPEDVLGRLDSQDFVVLLRGVGDTAVLSCAERIRLAVANEFLPTETPSTVTVSVGVATSTESDTAGERLIELASARLQVAKSHGRNQVCGPEAVSVEAPPRGPKR